MLISILPHLSNEQAAERFQEHLPFTTLVLLPRFDLPELRVGQTTSAFHAFPRYKALTQRSTNCNCNHATSDRYFSYSCRCYSIQPEKAAQDYCGGYCCYGYSSSFCSSASSRLHHHHDYCFHYCYKKQRMLAPRTDDVHFTW